MDNYLFSVKFSGTIDELKELKGLLGSMEDKLSSGEAQVVQVLADTGMFSGRLTAGENVVKWVYLSYEDEEECELELK